MISGVDRNIESPTPFLPRGVEGRLATPFLPSGVEGRLEVNRGLSTSLEVNGGGPSTSLGVNGSTSFGVNGVGSSLVVTG